MPRFPPPPGRAGNHHSRRHHDHAPRNERPDRRPTSRRTPPPGARGPASGARHVTPPAARHPCSQPTACPAEPRRLRLFGVAARPGPRPPLEEKTVNPAKTAPMVRPPTRTVSRMRAATCLTMALAVGLLASATAASAAPPARSTVVLDETFVYPVGGPNPCPFEVTFRNQGTFYVTTFVDAAGNTTHELDRGAYFLESYSANGKAISSKSPAMTHVDPATGTLVGTGNQRHFIVPGIGIVYAQAGRFVIDQNTGETISASGLDRPLSDRLCVALAP